MGVRSIGRAAGSFFAIVKFSTGAAALHMSITAVQAADDPPQVYRVVGVEADDKLHMRDVPHGDSKILADIPPKARGIKGLGCMTPEPSFDRWADMTPAERANAKLEWCRVEYHGKQGWVAARFLKPDGSAR
ncbi:SH3 domain-containing protein [Hyphomicrobium sp.]|uniref:SH3 domain-containing protein n=1 Tax=Hyphomicrobium sp. TaxID=82 RepID=UPI002E349B7D|nr:SH3 domain-containing protein [Hyphomicrobium sp.]HEX2843440.1 SH3 domain-containing protein [Hyphomicrobium sp.]